DAVAVLSISIGSTFTGNAFTVSFSVVPAVAVTFTVILTKTPLRFFSSGTLGIEQVTVLPEAEQVFGSVFTSVQPAAVQLTVPNCALGNCSPLGKVSISVTLFATVGHRLSRATL